MTDRVQVTDERGALEDLGTFPEKAEWRDRHNCLPFHLPSDDAFEICCFILLLREHPRERIYYYGKTGDRGRDIVYRHRDGTVEFVQCKRYGSTLGVGEIRKELAKLCVNVFLKRLPEAPDRITFYVVPDLSSDAQDLVGSQEKWKATAAKALEDHLLEDPSPELLQFAQGWWPNPDRVAEVAPGERAQRWPELVERFFAVRKVIEGSVAQLLPLLSDIREEILAISEGIAKRLLPHIAEPRNLATKSGRDGRAIDGRRSGIAPVPQVTPLAQARDKAARFRLHVAAPSAGLKLVGRASDLLSIHQKLEEAVRSNIGVVALHGVPGVGKSSLVNYFGHDPTLGRLFPDGGLWTAVGNTPDVGELIRMWGRGIRIPAAQMLRVDEAVGAIRQKLQRKRMLVLVDDVWTDAHAEMFRVGGPGSVVLYATRLPALAHRLAPAPQFIYALPGLETPQALELLASHAPDVVRDYPQPCEDLVRQIEGLPLAIIVAGKMLQREHSHGEDVKQLLKSIREDARVLLTESAPPSMSDLLKQTTPNVAAVLRRSTDVLDEKQKWYFARLGAFASSPATFDAKFAARCWKVTADEAKQIAKYFVDLGLLSVPRRGHFQIHPLMQALALHEWDLLHE